MKIKKNTNVTACDAIAPASEPILGDGNCCKYDSAIALIGSAIEALAAIAKDDQVAKDSIANLGVVMLDLKGNCCQGGECQ